MMKTVKKSVYQQNRLRILRFFFPSVLADSCLSEGVRLRKASRLGKASRLNKASRLSKASVYITKPPMMKTIRNRIYQRLGARQAGPQVIDTVHGVYNQIFGTRPPGPK